MRPHYSQSTRENATPSSGTSPLAYYKEVTPRVKMEQQTSPPPPKSNMHEASQKPKRVIFHP